MQKIKLTDLIDVQVLQRMQDGFSKYTGMASLTTDENGIPVTKGSSFTKFCTEYVRKSELGLKRCKECDKKGAHVAAKTGCAATYVCHAGLIDYSAPIMVEGQVIGSFIGGQVRKGEINEEEFRKTAIELGIDPDVFVDEAKKAYVLDQETVERTAEFLAEIAKVLSEMAYQNYVALQKSKKMERASRSQANYVMDSISNLKKDLKEWNGLLEEGIYEEDMDAMQNLLKEIKRGSDEAVADISDAIAYVRLSGGKSVLKETEYDIHYVIKMIKNAIKPDCKKYGVSVNIKLDEEMPFWYMGDVARISLLITRVLQMIMEDTKEDSILEISSHKNSYSTWLIFSIKGQIADTLTEKTEWELEENIVEQMNGMVNFVCDDTSDMYIKVSLPQLAVEGGD